MSALAAAYSNDNANLLAIPHGANRGPLKSQVKGQDGQASVNGNYSVMNEPH